MPEEEAETLRSHATLVSSQVEGSLQVIDVEDDLIAADGERIELVEVGEKEPDFRSIIAHRSGGISTCGERGRKFNE